MEKEYYGIGGHQKDRFDGNPMVSSDVRRNCVAHALSKPVLEQLDDAKKDSYPACSSLSRYSWWNYREFHPILLYGDMALCILLYWSVSG